MYLLVGMVRIRNGAEVVLRLACNPESSNVCTGLFIRKVSGVYREEMNLPPLRLKIILVNL